VFGDLHADTFLTAEEAEVAYAALPPRIRPPTPDVAFVAVWTRNPEWPAANRRFPADGLAIMHDLDRPMAISAVRADAIRTFPIIMLAAISSPGACLVLPGETCPHGWTLEPA
jgi:hypothetical protein